MLGRIRGHLLRGEVGQGRLALEALWHETPPRDIEDLLRLAKESLTLAGLYRWHDVSRAVLERARATIEDCDGGPAQRTRATLLLDGLEARTLYVTNDREASVQFFERFLQAAARDASLWQPWIVNFRLVSSIDNYRFAVADDLLRFAPVTANCFTALESGMRLRFLALRFAFALDYGSAERVLIAAERKLLSAALGPEREIHRAYAFAARARLLAYRGEHERAMALLQRARQLVLPLKVQSVLMSIRSTEATMLRERGDLQEAADIFLGLAHRFVVDSSADPKNAYPDVQILIVAARTALMANRTRAAHRLLKRVDALLELCPDELLSTFKRILEGRLELSRGTRKSLQRASKAIKTAEQTIARRGWTETTIHLYLLLTQGWLAVAQRRIGDALETVFELQRHSREHRFVRFQAEALYLQSTLLLESSPPSSTLYDRTLSRLGSIRNPQMFFKVVANLYLYTWEVREDIALADLHMKQISGIREHMDEGEFRELYDSHIARPMMSRIRKRLAGG